MEPAELENDFLDTKIPDNPIYVSEQAEFLLNKVVAQSVHVSAPTFIGHMTSAIPYFMLPLSKVMIALNQNLVKIETSKAFTPLEKQVLGMMHRLVYERDDSFYATQTHSRTHSLGALCSGGTIANLTALWAARNHRFVARGKFNGIRRDGLFAAMTEYGFSGVRILISERGHYSFRKAVDLLGFGHDALVPVKTDTNDRIDLAALDDECKRADQDGALVLAIIGVAGTTETGSVDDLNALAERARARKCWFHVDAAWGGATLFSERYSNLLSGIEQADSVTIDAHKQLYVPMGAGMVLFREQESLKNIEHSANYVIREGSRDIGKHTLEGSRSGMALLVHSGLRVMGRKGYGLLIDIGIEKARSFADMIKSESDFELISEPQLNLLTYRYLPKAIQSKLMTVSDAKRIEALNDINALTISIQKQQRTDGKSFVSRTTLKPQKYQRQETIVLRVVLANPLTTEKHLKAVLDEQRVLGERIFREEHAKKLETILG
jgi:glutamate decarboxylase